MPEEARATQVLAYVEHRVDPQARATQVLAYVEHRVDAQARATQVLAYVELQYEHPRVLIQPSFLDYS